MDFYPCKYNAELIWGVKLIFERKGKYESFVTTHTPCSFDLLYVYIYIYMYAQYILILGKYGRREKKISPGPDMTDLR